MKRDSSIELARLLACLGVIGIHTALSPNLGGVYEWDKIFLGCLTTDAVGVFLMITGCFFFRRTNYKRLWLGTLQKLMLPVALYSLFIFYLSGWAFEGKTLLESVSHPIGDYVNVVRSLLTLSHPTADGGHFWYVYVYLLLVLVAPLLGAAARYLEESEARQRNFLLASLALFALNDFTNNQLAWFSFVSLNGLVPACVVVLWGHILYRNRERFLAHRGRSMLVSAGTFLLVNLGRTFVQLYRYETGGDRNKHILFWYTSVGLICAACVMIFCLSAVNAAKDSRMKRAIVWLASYTFPVYVVHVKVTQLLNESNVILDIHMWIYQFLHGFPCHVLCALASILAVFGTSFALVWALSLIPKGLTIMKKRLSA